MTFFYKNNVMTILCLQCLFIMISYGCYNFEHVFLSWTITIILCLCSLLMFWQFVKLFDQICYDNLCVVFIHYVLTICVLCLFIMFWQFVKLFDKKFNGFFSYSSCFDHLWNCFIKWSWIFILCEFCAFCYN